MEQRDFAVELVDDFGVDTRVMLIACLKWMSEDDVKNMLEANEYPSAGSITFKIRKG